jgi:hypothetical protein
MGLASILSPPPWDNKYAEASNNIILDTCPVMISREPNNQRVSHEPIG